MSIPSAGLVRRVFWVSLLCLGPRTGQALEAGRPIGRYLHDVWQSDSPLPFGDVQTIVQERRGYIWLGSSRGLIRFDGARFTVFDSASVPELEERNVRALLEGADGSLWIGTHGGGLVRFKEGRWRAWSVRDGLADGHVLALAETRDGSLWIGTRAGLSRFKDGAFTTYGIRDGLSDPVIRALREDRQGRLWIGSYGGGLSCFDGGRFQTYTLRDWGGPPYTTTHGGSRGAVLSIGEDRDGAIWFGTESGGVSRFKDGRFAFYDRGQGLPGRTVRAIRQDRDGNLWIGTDGGLARFEGDRFAVYGPGDGLSAELVKSLYEDREGSLWVGTRDGLDRFKDSKFAVYAMAEGLPTDFVESVSGDGRDVWIGTRRGLTRWRDGRMATFTMRDGLPSDVVHALGHGADRKLWVGTAGGLASFDGRRFRRYGPRDGLAGESVFAILADPDGTLWIGTSAGLSRLRNGSFTVYTARDGMSSPDVRALHRDRGGTLWIGSYAGGLMRFDGKHFRAFTARDGLSNENVFSILEDAEGTIWAGTDQGLNRIRDGRITAYRVRDGLPDDTIYQVLQNASLDLWISCPKGVLRVRHRDLEDFARGRSAALPVTSFGKADGMRSSECTGRTQPAGWKGGDGRLWFPTTKGVVVIDPARIAVNRQPPSVVVEQVGIDGAAADAVDGLTLPPGSERLEFQYTGLSLLAPEKVRFRYRLEGFDSDWVDAGTRRTAYYTNLFPGRYTFRVIACNNDGIWSEQGASLGLRLRPHFYQTRSFYALGAGLVALAGWGVHRLRIRQVHARFAAVLAERTRMARELHDTLEQGLMAVRLQLEATGMRVTEGRRVIERHLRLARDIVDGVLAEARRSVWGLRSPALEDADLPTALSSAARRLTEGTPVEARVQLRGTPRRLPGIVELNLLRIGQEAITNALKHAHARQIQLELAFDRGRVRLCARDDGRGFDPQAAPPQGHFGLKGMRERVQELGGEMSLHSTPSGGTRIVVEVPVG